jgi:haloalkane dehalogenase
MPTIDVLDSTMYYEDQGAGAAFVFLHGNPTSSYLWRNVLPAIGDDRRRLAPDLIGMGRSGKPDLAYKFDDHARYLDAWIDAVGLDELVFVGIDWGGALAFDWAARHPGRVRAFMETIVKPLSYDDFPDPQSARERYRALRGARPARSSYCSATCSSSRPCRQRARQDGRRDDGVYREPYPTSQTRLPMLEWARSMPLDGEPADVVDRIEAYDRWLSCSDDVAKLLLVRHQLARDDRRGPGRLVCRQHRRARG